MLLLLLLVSHFSRVQLCATPQTAAHQAPPSLGFSRQEHWSGLPFLLQCMKVKSESEVAQSCRLLVTPWTAAYQAPPSMGFPRQQYWSGLPLPSPIYSILVKVKVIVVFDSLRPHGLQPNRLLRPWDFPGTSTGVGCHHALHSVGCCCCW